MAEMALESSLQYARGKIAAPWHKARPRLRMVTKRAPLFLQQARRLALAHRSSLLPALESLEDIARKRSLRQSSAIPRSPRSKERQCGPPPPPQSARQTAPCP